MQGNVKIEQDSEQLACLEKDFYAETTFPKLETLISLHRHLLYEVQRADEL